MDDIRIMKGIGSSNELKLKQAGIHSIKDCWKKVFQKKAEQNLLKSQK